MVGVETTSNRSKGAGQLMIAIVLIGIAAGAASGLMFASVISRAASRKSCCCFSSTSTE